MHLDKVTQLFALIYVIISKVKNFYNLIFMTIDFHDNFLTWGDFTSTKPSHFSLVYFQDKTFGLKNKKGAKQQRFIQQVQHQVKYGGNKSARELEKEKENLLKKKEDKKKELAEINALFKPVQQLAGKGIVGASLLKAYYN